MENLEMKPHHASFLLEVEKFLGGFKVDECIGNSDLANFSLIRGFIQGMVASAGYTDQNRADLPPSPIKFGK